MQVLVLRADLHIPAARSLKDKRSSVTPVVRHLDRLTGVGASEVGYQDKWQRTALGVSVIGGTVSVVERTMDDVERYLWSRPDVEVIELARSWWEEDLIR
jgi:uncharacterized protein YlxP (DUF503 family)